MDKELHIKTGTIPAEHSEKLHELRKEIAKESVEYRINEDVHDFVTDRILHHFLIARKYDVMKACTMLKTALEWRAKREPHNLFKVDMYRHEAIKMSHEAETGKIRLAGRDRYDREVVIFDNSVQNTQDSDGQLTFLAWNLEMAIHTLPPHVDKYVVFMHLENFSVLNCPPYQTTRETILMLTTCYPERLGHCICYKGPSYFYYVFNLMKSLGLIDPRTLQKITFIQGDVSDGSPNDALMTGILGRNWKELTAAEGDILEEGCSPGFRHAEYWPWVLQRWDQIISILSNSHNGDGNASPTDSRGDAMKRLSMKIPAHYDMGSVSSGSESYSGEEEEDEQLRNKQGQAESPTNVSLPRSTLPNLSFRQFKRDPLTQVVLLLRPLVALLKALFHILGMVFEWADNIKDMPVYGTVTVQICVGTLTICGVVCYIIHRFFTTIYKTIMVVWSLIWHTVQWCGCAFDRTGGCQQRFLYHRVIPVAWTLWKLAPFVLLPLVFVVFLQIYNEAKDAEHSWFENMEHGLDLMGSRATHKIRRTASRMARKAKRAERKIFSHYNRQLQTPLSDNDDDNNYDDDYDVDVPDVSNLQLSKSGRIQPAGGSSTTPRSPGAALSPATDGGGSGGSKKIFSSPPSPNAYGYNDPGSSGSGGGGGWDDSDDSNEGQEDSSYHVVGHGGNIVHGQAARRLSMKKGSMTPLNMADIDQHHADYNYAATTPDTSGRGRGGGGRDKGTQSAPGSLKNPGRKTHKTPQSRHRHHDDAEMSTRTPASPLTPLRTSGHASSSSSSSGSGSGSPLRAHEYHHLPEQDRPMELDSEDLPDLDGY